MSPETGDEAGGPAMTGLGEQRLARAALTYLAEPADPALGALLAICEPAEVLAAIKADMLPVTGPGCGDTTRSRTALERALGRWRARLPGLPGGGEIEAICRDGIRLVCPGDPRWPERLDELGSARPYALWLRGRADLASACLRSVSIVGSRAATGYGAHVAGEIAADLAEQGWVIVSGGAYGIDAAAHRGALVAHAMTIAVLACGVDHPYPAGHADLFADIAAAGLVISEWPPGRHPARLRFLVRNRVIAALTCGTVIVEAGGRSGALNTARHAGELGRPLMAVPGPVTSSQSAGCHQIIREWGATLVTCAADVTEMVSPLGVPGIPAPMGSPAPAQAGSPAPASARELASKGVLPSRDLLDPESARVLDALPARGGAGPSMIAVEAGVDLDTVLRCLGLLAGCGFIERCDQGWRMRRVHQAACRRLGDSRVPAVWGYSCDGPAGQRSGSSRRAVTPATRLNRLRRISPLHSAEFAVFYATQRGDGALLPRCPRRPTFQDGLGGQRSLPDRLTALGLPVLVAFGSDDRRWRSSSAAAYRRSGRAACRLAQSRTPSRC